MFFVAVTEQDKMLVAHKVIPHGSFRFAGNGSKRAYFGAFLCLAAVWLIRLLHVAIE